MYFSIGYFIIGCILLIICVYLTTKKRRIYNNSTVVMSSILSIRRGIPGNSAAITVEFTAEDKLAEKHIQEIIMLYGYTKYKVNDKLEIRVHNDGIKVRVFYNSWIQYWYLCIVLWIIFIICMSNVFYQW